MSRDDDVKQAIGQVARLGGFNIKRMATTDDLKEGRTPADVLTKIMISIPGDETQGRHILWKWIDICGGTHVRELQVRCVLDDAERGEAGMAAGSTQLVANVRAALHESATAASRRTDGTPG